MAARIPQRTLLVAVSVAAAALLLTGCLRSEMAIEVSGDGSGTATFEAYFDEVDLDEVGVTQDQLVDLVETATQSIDGAEVSAVGRQGSRGFRVSIPFDDYRQLTQALTTGEYGGYSTRIFQSFEVTEGAEGHWSMNAVMDPAGFRAALTQIPAGLSGSLTVVDSSTELVFSVTLPGKVFRSNATSVDGGTARWELNGDTGAVNFTMDSEPAGFTTLQLILAGTGALLLVGFILVLTTAAGSRRRWTSRRRVRRRRRKGQGPDPKEQWQPKVPAPGTVGGRDESVLPVMQPTAAAPATAYPAAPAPTPSGPVAGSSYSVASTAPPPASTPPPVAPPPFAPPQPMAPPPLFAPQPPAQPPSPAPSQPTPGLVAPPATVSPTVPPPTAPPPVAPPAPDQSHWLAPLPHEDPDGHWLDRPPEPDQPADPTAWEHLPPRTDDIPRFEYPEVHDL